MPSGLQRGSAFRGPATAQRPRRRRSHDLCEGCGHFRSEHRSGTDCERDDCSCQAMAWTPPVPARLNKPKTMITDEIKAQMESLLQSGLNYRKVAATIGCSIQAVRNHCPGYGDNGRADVQAHREIFKHYLNRRIDIDKRTPGKEHKQ